MIGSLLDLLVNLVATGIAFTLGISFRRISSGFRTRALRAFWKPIVRGGAHIAIGSFMENSYYKYVGMGDLDAYVQLKDQLRQVGARDFEFGPVHQVTKAQRKGNLILLGGPNSNPLSAKVMEQVPRSFSFVSAEGSGGPVADGKIYDSELDTETDCPRNEETGLRETDQGIIIRCPNPFAPDKSVLIVAGSWRFGTAAGMRLIEKHDFLHNLVVKSDAPFEAVFSCRVLDDEIANIQLRKVRRLLPLAERMPESTQISSSESTASPTRKEGSAGAATG